MPVVQVFDMKGQSLAFTPVDVAVVELELGEFLGAEVAVIHRMWVVADELADIYRALCTIIEGEQHAKVANVFCLCYVDDVGHIFLVITVVLMFCFLTKYLIHFSII